MFKYKVVYGCLVFQTVVFFAPSVLVSTKILRHLLFDVLAFEQSVSSALVCSFEQFFGPAILVDLLLHVCCFFFSSVLVLHGLLL